MPVIDSKIFFLKIFFMSDLQVFENILFMKYIRSLFLVILMSFLVLPGKGQEFKEDEVVVIKGERFFLHQVHTGETIYSISKNYKIDRAKLVELNPHISQGLNIGEILKITYRDDIELLSYSIKKGDPVRFSTHVVKSRRETPYFIAQKYGITVEELYAYNPKVKRFRKRTVLRIPHWDSLPGTSETVDSLNTNAEGQKNIVTHVVKSGETLYSIAKRYKVSESEILFFNPDARNLKAGKKLMFPANGKSDLAAEKKDGLEKGNYIEHVIAPGETMWSITHRYNVSSEELIDQNPTLRNKFPVGQTIKIPKKTGKGKTDDDNGFIRHEVQKGETLFGLTQRYNTTLPEIKKYNPALAYRSPKTGEILYIPHQAKNIEDTIKQVQPSRLDSIQLIYSQGDESRTLIIPPGCEPNVSANWSHTFQVSLFLPLYINENIYENSNTVIDPNNQDDSDDEGVAKNYTQKNKKFYRNSEKYIRFYEGVLIAVDSMQKAGMRIALHVFDTRRDRNTVRKIISSPKFYDSDLIIGPVYQEIQKDVAEAAKTYHIPMVSPFEMSSEQINGNGCFFMVNPGKDYLAEKTAQMIFDDFPGCNFILLRSTDYTNVEDNKIGNLVRNKYLQQGVSDSLTAISYKDINFEASGVEGLRGAMSSEKENLVFIPSTVEGELSVTISNLNNLANEFPITLIAPFDYQQRYPSIDVAQYHYLKMTYVYPYWTDYQSYSTLGLIKAFRQNFAVEPDNFSFHGFDITFYFLNALRNYGNNFCNCIPFLHLPLSQGSYHFERLSANGGFTNLGVSVISYQKDFTIVQKKTLGKPKLGY